MIRHFAHRRLFIQLISIMVLVSITVALAPAPVHAWKPKTHIFFAEIALQDATDDGKVTIYKVDYATGKIGEKLGDYAVDPDILAALRSHPKQYRAGVLGPDAYPDIMTGQQVIHPESKDPERISNSWLEHLWAAAGNDGGAKKAFVTGYLTHAAGDMFGHTFVNQYTKDPFEIGQNAIKHIVVEGYVGKRTPATVSEDEVSIDGVEDFIYQYMVKADPGSALNEDLYVGDLRVHLTVPYLFSDLRASLQQDIGDYDRTKADYDRRAAAKGRAAEDCGFFDPCSAVVLRAQQGLILGEKGAYMALEGPGTTYFEYWRDDIDEGLKAWPALSHDIAQALVYDTDDKRFNDVKEEVTETADDYVNDHLLSMAGAPDAVGATRSIIGKVTDVIKPVKDAIAAMKRELLSFILKEATGKTLDEILDYLKSPELHFDPVMTDPGPGEEITLAKFNNDVLKITDTAFDNPSERFDYREFPAAHNSVTISKLVLLSRDGMNQLLKDLGSSQTLEEPNVMLGFLHSLDDDNQWHEHVKKMVFARDCASYRQLFMHQIGEEGGCLRPEDSAQLKIDANTATAVTTCREGLTLLTENMYEHPQQPDPPAIEKRNWADVYKDFRESNLPSCDIVGKFLKDNENDPSMAAIKAAMAEDGVTNWQNYWTTVRVGSIYGITATGDRIRDYCPSQHYLQFDCVTGPERISSTISAVNDILDLLD